MRLLLDADVLAYKAAFATEKTLYLVTDRYLVTEAERAAGERVGQEFTDAKTAKAACTSNSTLWSRKDVKPAAEAIETLDAMVSDICRQLEGSASDVVMILTGVGNFRHKIATRADYKGNRFGERPKNYNAVREHMIDKWKAIVTAGEEADDRLGIEMTRDPNSVCCSIDKDLRQLPGWHYDFTTGDLVLIDQRQADLSFYAQVLSGDDVDNVPGLKGIGKVKAKSALAECVSAEECWHVCQLLYHGQFGKKGAKYAIEAARLLHVRRKPKQIWSSKLADSQPWDISLEDIPSPRKPLEFSPITEEVE